MTGRKILLSFVLFAVVLGAAAAIGYKEKYRVKKFIKNRPALYEQARRLAKVKSDWLGREKPKHPQRQIDRTKASWALVFDAAQSLGTYQRFWGNIGFESFKTGVLKGRALRLFRYMRESNQRLGDGSFEGNVFRYCRAHNLFSNGIPPWGEGLDIYHLDANGNASYSWQTVDQVFRRIGQAGLKPIIEFGFMPDALASMPDRRQKWGRGNISPPKDYRKWQALVYETTRHLVERFGAEEVASWYFEVWNEPDLSWLFWIEDPRAWRKPYGDLAEYHKLYDFTVAAAKSAFPRIRIGGPASAGGDINFLLEHLFADASGDNRGNYAPIDFVSTHAYGRVGEDYRQNMKRSLPAKLYWKLGSAVKHDVAAVREQAQRLPLLLTETGPKYKKRIVNEGRFVAAWYAKMVDSMFYVGESAGRVYQPREVVYWAGEQVVKSFAQRKGGIAAAVKSGGSWAVFKLPIYNAIEALGHLSDERIALKSGSRFGETVHAIATRNGRESIEILLYHLDEDINERRRLHYA